MNPIKIKKAGPIKKAIFTIVLAVALVFSPIQAHQTQAFWGEIVQAVFHSMLSQIFDMIKGMMVGMMKQMAVQQITNQMNSTIGGGSSGGAKFITDWQDYLVGQPQSITQSYMNDYISQMTRGRGSLSGYSSGRAGEGFMGSGNYISALNQNAQNIINPKMPQITYEGDPSQMFASGNFKNLGTYTSGINNPWALNAHVSEQYNQKLAENKANAQARAIANQGFINTGEENGNGISSFPGILTKEGMANAQDLGNKIIGGANSIQEVITSVVSQMMTKSIQQGFSGAQKSNQRQSNINSQANQSSQQSNDPSARFNTQSGQ